MKRILIILSLLCAISAAGRTPKPEAVIFETDLGNDIDDVLALDLLYKAMDEGRIDLLAVSCHKQSDYACRFADMLNVWYGYPGITVARAPHCVRCDLYTDYTAEVCRADSARGLYAPSGRRPEDAVKMYRRMLSSRPDRSVTIISVGFCTVLAELLDTPADEYSRLTGRELVAAKVKCTSVMAGSFGPKARAEFNVVNDIAAARKFFDEWPAPIVVLPFEPGTMVQFPGKVMEAGFDWAPHHPAVEAYRSYKPMPYDRAMWDPLAVFYVTDPGTDLLTRSEPGRIEIDEKGYMWFKPCRGGRDIVVSVDKRQAACIKSLLTERISRRPKNFR